MSEGLKMAIILAVCTFVLSLGLVTMYSGQNFTRVFMSSVNDVATYASSSEIEAIGEYNGDIPAATLYIVLSKDPGRVESISGTAYGIIVNSVDDLRMLFKTQIHVTVLRNIDRYRIIISP